MPDHADQELDQFVREKGCDYEVGHAYYEFKSNKEDIPEGREVILMNKVCCTNIVCSAIAIVCYTHDMHCAL